jgi:hypothetical protein
MIVKKIKLKELLLFAILLISILPIINLGGFDMPILYLFLPISLIVFMFVILGRIKIPYIIKPIILLFLLIIIEIFLSALIASVTAFNKIIFPNDIIQYVTRFMCIISFILLFYHSKLEAKLFIKMFLVTLTLGMVIGILQWIPWGGQVFFINLYPFREGTEQLAQLDRVLYLRRVHGFAQFATANGGVATFAFIFAYSVYAYLKKFKLLAILLMVASLVNVVASQARAGMLALAFSVLAFYFIKVYISGKSLRPTITLLLSIFLLFIFTYIMFVIENPFIVQMVYRWGSLLESGGGARIDQIRYGLELLADSNNYFFGISRVFQSYSGLAFHLEVEPVNIFVLYGLFGFVLQYSLILYLLRYFMKSARVAKNNPEIASLMVASFVGLLSYQVFSLGYFFFREIRIGLIPWILLGVTIGLYERQKRYQKPSQS